MTVYKTDGQGRWLRVEHAEQCPQELFLAERCQGAVGHEGAHWSYLPDGSLEYEDQDPDGFGGDIPPEHKTWVHPKKMRKHYYLSQLTVTEVTDAKLIARLEAGKLRKGECIDRPVDCPAPDQPPPKTPKFK